MDEPPFNTDLPPKPSRHERTRGQRLLLTRAHITEVARLLPRTLYVETVAAQMGVHRQTFWQWLKAGSRESLRREEGLDSDSKWDLHVELYYAVKKTLAVCEGDYAVNVQCAGADAKNWTANAWLLERRFPQRWSQNRAELKQIQKQLAEIAKNNAPPPQKSGEEKREAGGDAASGPHVVEPRPGS
jgi:hypothetical protein